MLMVGTSGMNVYAPSECLRYVDKHIETTFCMNQCSDEFSKSWYNMYPVNPDDIINFDAAGRKFVAKALKMDHTVPTLGYTFDELRTRLRQDLVGKSGKEIAKLRKEGENVSENYQIPMFVYMGDTSIQAVHDHLDELAKYSTIIIECTFLNEEHRGSGLDAKKHIAWQELWPVIEELGSTITWILIHFSMRYSSTEIKEFFDDIKKSGICGNIIPWI
jgi:ribonuclease BN (tRNA processing enzyme)